MGNRIMLMTDSLNIGVRSYFELFELELTVDLICWCCWCCERSTTEESTPTDCCIEPISQALLDRSDLTTLLMGSGPTIASFYSPSQRNGEGHGNANSTNAYI